MNIRPGMPVGSLRANPFRSAADADLQSPSSSKSDQAYMHLRSQILSSELKPGQRVNEESISAALNISRTPVREALRRLENDGLVTIYPKRYAEVTSYSPKDIQTLGIVRLSQDILAGRLAIYFGSDAEFSQLQPLADKCEERAAAQDLPGRIAADLAFHLKIAEIGKNDLLMKYQKELYLRIHLLQIQYSASWDDTKERVGHHSSIIDALLHRDEEAFIRTTCTRFLELYDLDPKLVALYEK